MPRIQRLDVQGFRGIRQSVALLFEGKSVMLFGENGAGKSSFVDGLDKILTGRVSSLDGRAQGLSSERHGPHIRNGDNPTQIAITFDDATKTAFSLESDRANLPTSIQEYLEAAQESLYILRRRQVLEFIESPPRERYDLLRPFLPLSGIEAIENGLRQARDRAEAEAQKAKQEVARLIQDLGHVLRDQSISQDPGEQEVIAAIYQELAALGQPLITRIDQLREATARLDNTLAAFGDLSRQSRLISVVRGLEDLVEAILRINTASLVAALTTLQERETREARVLYEAVLEQGIRWIGEESRRTCPLCEQPIDPERVAGRVQERMAAVKEVLNLRKASRRELESARQNVFSAMEATHRAEASVRDLAPDEKAEVEQAVRTAENILQTIGTGLREDIATLSIDALRSYSAQVGHDSHLVGDLARCRDVLHGRLSSLPSLEAAQKLLSLRERLARVAQIWENIQRTRAVATEAEERGRVVRTIYENAQVARREELQSLFDELSKKIDDIYVHLHPDEGHSGVRLEVREAVQRSVNLRADFYDRQSQDPRAYYSDAHLDTLGLSIFLALRDWYRKQTPRFDLMVLDDVLTSVDTAHAVRFSEFLLSEFRDYQILLTTHDRIWFEHLRDIQARCGISQGFVNKVIHKWTIDEGPDLREPEDERQAIDGLIQDGSAQEIAMMAGRLFEHVLQEMRYALRLSVQAKRNEQYEIGELWPALYSAIKKEYPMLYEQARTTLNALDVLWPVRNWIGAHWNTWARNQPRSVAVEFAAAVSDLFDRTFCTSCQKFIAPSVTPSGQLACPRGHKLYPARGREAVQPKSRNDLVRATQGAFRDARLDTAQYFEWKRAETGRER